MRILFCLACNAAIALPAVAADVSKLPPAADRKIDYAKDVQPIFAAACYECHGEKKQQSSFRLDRKVDALRGGEIGKAIVPDKSADSPLIHYVAGLDKDLKMPPKGDRLTAEHVEEFRTWMKTELMIAFHRGLLPAEVVDLLMSHFDLAGS